MKTRESKRRIAIVTAVLLVAVAAGGVITWQNFGKGKGDQTASEDRSVETISEEISDDAVADTSDGNDAVQPEETLEPDSEETSGNAEGQMDVTGEETAAAQAGQTDAAQETSGEDTAAQTAAEPQITLDFSEDTVLQTPVSGQILIPYNMENTV